MAPDDPLQAAKAAALHELAEQVVTTSDTQPSRSTRRRRKRKRPKTPVPSNDEPTPEDISDAEREKAIPEYEPESVERFVTSEKDPVSDELLEAMRRFQRRGQPQAIDDENPESTFQNQQTTTENDTTEQVTASLVKETAAPIVSGPSRKKRKEQRRALITNLKWLSGQPTKIEQWDVTAPDPVLLALLKTTRCSVSVPVNWSLKRKYLQNKRGVEKRAVPLPAYIAATGVGEARDAQREADDAKTLKQRQRERMRAKLGRGVEIDEQRLHDAFFKFQTRPRMTRFGEVYHELRELEVDSSWFKPGVLSEELRAALGISKESPPPWLSGMQRWGPPPGWPGLKVPGVNIPIPAGASYGYQPGGWGKVPVDESGRPLYGDVFNEGLRFEHFDERFDESEARKAWRWGALRKEEAVVQQKVVDDEEGEEEGEGDVDRATSGGEARRDVDAGSGVGRKEAVSRRELYQVMPQRRTTVGSNDMMGSSHVYELNRRRNGRD